MAVIAPLGAVVISFPATFLQEVPRRMRGGILMGFWIFGGEVLKVSVNCQLINVSLSQGLKQIWR